MMSLTRSLRLWEKRMQQLEEVGFLSRKDTLDQVYDKEQLIDYVRLLQARVHEVYSELKIRRRWDEEISAVNLKRAKEIARHKEGTND